MTGVKDENGIPNGDQWLEEYHASLAARDLIQSWTTVSDGALENFMNSFFSKTWNSYDSTHAGHLDDTQVVGFMRELMTAMTPSVGPTEPNPYDFEIVHGRILTRGEQNAPAQTPATAPAPTPAPAAVPATPPASTEPASPQPTPAPATS